MLCLLWFWHVFTNSLSKTWNFFVVFKHYDVAFWWPSIFTSFQRNLHNGKIITMTGDTHSVDFRMLSLLFLLFITLAKAKEELSVYPIIMPMVVPSKNEIYLCTSIDLSQTNETFWIRGFEPRVSKSNVHHMIVAASETKPPQSPFNVWNCGNDRLTI